MGSLSTTYGGIAARKTLASRKVTPPARSSWLRRLPAGGPARSPWGVRRRAPTSRPIIRSAATRPVPSVITLPKRVIAVTETRTSQPLTSRAAGVTGNTPAGSGRPPSSTRRARTRHNPCLHSGATVSEINRAWDIPEIDRTMTADVSAHGRVSHTASRLLRYVRDMSPSDEARFV